MPDLPIKHVLSSSESEKAFPATNLLSTNRRSWKGKAGKDANFVVLKLEKEERITHVNIGNEFSAFIEVLVAKSCDPEPKFMALIDSCTCMDPNECRNEKNGGRVKMICADKMIPSVANQKWDIVKLVCKQPFNRRIGFGLAFINLVGGDEPVSNASAETRLLSNIDPIGARTYFDEINLKLKEQEVADTAAREEQTRQKEVLRMQKEKMMSQARDVRERKRKATPMENSDELSGHTNVGSPFHSPSSMILDSRGRAVMCGAITVVTPKTPTNKVSA